MAEEIKELLRFEYNCPPLTNNLVTLEGYREDHWIRPNRAVFEHMALGKQKNGVYLEQTIRANCPIVFGRVIAVAAQDIPRWGVHPGDIIFIKRLTELAFGRGRSLVHYENIMGIFTERE